MRVAAIDLGSNSVLLLVAEIGADGAVRRIEERAAVPRLGRGVGETGRLDSKAAAATLRVLREYAAAALAAGATDLHCVATAGLRDARPEDRARFVRSAAAVGVRIEVIDGDEEAALTALAVVRSLPDLGEDLTVLDLGGRSTEVVRVEGGRPAARCSLPVGAVSLTERFLTVAPPPPAVRAAARAVARRILAEAGPHRAPLVAAGGTATTLAAILRGIEPYDPDLVHGTVVSRDELEALVGRIATLDRDSLAALPGLPADRADIALGGALTLAAAADVLGADELVVSDRGVRWGVVYSAG